MDLFGNIKNGLARVLRLLSPRFYYSKSLQGSVADQFHRVVYDLGERGKTSGDTRWLGVLVGKIPFDLWVYQEILFETQPDLIVECGTCRGGSAYYLASLMDLIGKGRIITIDVIEPPNMPKHPRITFLHGSSTADEIISKVRTSISGDMTVMVILDSDHSEIHVSRELQLYSPLATKGQYLVVEDTNVNGHPVYSMHGPGPMEALQKFLPANNQFQVDRSREKYLVTYN